MDIALFIRHQFVGNLSTWEPSCPTLIVANRYSNASNLNHNVSWWLRARQCRTTTLQWCQQIVVAAKIMKIALASWKYCSVMPNNEFNWFWIDLFYARNWRQDGHISLDTENASDWLSAWFVINDSHLVSSQIFKFYIGAISAHWQIAQRTCDFIRTNQLRDKAYSMGFNGFSHLTREASVQREVSPRKKRAIKDLRECHWSVPSGSQFIPRNVRNF